jgi:VIT1/CCC1 family predicted Fe2+/Mn2+ transporter
MLTTVSYLESWKEEKRSAFLYRAVADKEKGTSREILFQKLAREAERQSEIWVSKMKEGKLNLPSGYRPDLRVRIVAALVGLLGPRAMRSALAALKVRGLSLYDVRIPGHATPVSVDDVGLRHKATKSGGNLRAAVFGVNDGLVSNAGLILGVAGATNDPHTVLLAGIAGLLAGAFSMAAGEFLSVRSQREMYEYQIGLEREELAEYPEQEAEELALIYEAKGLSEGEAKALADKLIHDPEKALDTLSREELGLDPNSLGSSWGAAGFSFVSFAFGAVIPLLPFLVSYGPTALYRSIGLTALCLFGVGAVLTLFTGRNALLGGLRMLAIGSAAGAVTYGIGRLLGVTLS